MSTTKKKDTRGNHAQSLDFVSSKRLKALKEAQRAHLSECNQPEDPKRQFITQQVAKIIAALPPGKQNNLFKIRYGMTPETLQALPNEQALKILDLIVNNEAITQRNLRAKPWKNR